MKKSIEKRIKITRNGKIVRRSTGVNHFRTRKSRKNLRSKSRPHSLTMALKKITDY